MTNLQVPVWGYWLMAAGLLCFLALVGKHIHMDRGLKRARFASP